MYDVAIIGGALTGSSTAYHLLSRDPALKVTVIEQDPLYEYAASARSNALVRVVFSQPENLLMSRYGQEFYGNFPLVLGVIPVPGKAGLAQGDPNGHQLDGSR